MPFRDLRQPVARDRRRPHHASTAPDFAVDGRQLPDVASAAAARASSSPRPTGSACSCPPGSPRADRCRCRSTACRGEARIRRRRRRRSRPASTRWTTRSSIATATSTSPTAARAASRCRSRSSACARTARARRSRPASSTRRRWRSTRWAGSTCRAASRAPSTASTATGRAEPFATDLGVACGLAFAPDGTLFVGDRSGTIFAVDRDGQADAVRDAAAERRGVSPGARAATALYVTAPTLSPYDAVYRDRPGRHGATCVSQAFGRPQGLAFDADGALLRRRGARRAPAGSTGCAPDGAPRARARRRRASSASPSIRTAALVVCSNDTAYRLPRTPERSAEYNPRRMSQLFQRKPIAALAVGQPTAAVGAAARASAPAI